jgi:hypothetical protein
MSRKHEATLLDDCLAAAFADSATPDTVAALIEETESAARAAGERLQATVSGLRERVTEVQAAEEDDPPPRGLRGGQGRARRTGR